ncbi:hypothetical protein QWZ16_24545 [Vibrio ostreicida]|uniref:Uncharacterized protein n=1 Tax=Vibrio ostreicida TaxID=526588 RepID=A0ABT8C2X9_9VIBR|nr:hypothetical protein [Vibrio ostreicida]MDN3610053.1 hypothetical protein [Vibrio ostreicida]MDN3612713.1 hypothetical protein [Vibrio ostreicida]MDN3612738.1 hypothetical protein [Vibrio ostreicida]
MHYLSVVLNSNSHSVTNITVQQRLLFELSSNNVFFVPHDTSYRSLHVLSHTGMIARAIPLLQWTCPKTHNPLILTYH